MEMSALLDDLFREHRAADQALNLKLRRADWPRAMCTFPAADLPVWEKLEPQFTATH